jgi:hypothetical protein
VSAIDEARIEPRHEKLLSPIRRRIHRHARGVEHKLADQLLGLDGFQSPAGDSYHGRIRELLEGAPHARNGTGST